MTASPKPHVSHSDPPARESPGTHTGRPEPDTEPGAGIFVWSIWIAAFVLVIVFAALYTIPIPWSDEWSHASVIAGERGLSFNWLWEQHNEHRILLPKLIWLLSLRWSGDNFRVLPFIDVLALGGLAFAMVRAAKRLRGRLVYTDAFFPLLILNPAQYENLVWAWQVGFVVPVILTGMILLLMIEDANTRVLRTWKGAAAASACLVLLPFSAAVGLAFGVAVSLWFLHLAWTCRRSADLSVRRKWRLFLAGGVFCPLMVFFYFHGLSRPPQIPPSPGVRAALVTGLQFLSGSFGMGAGDFAWPLLGLVILLFIAIGVAASLMAWRRSERERTRAAGLCLLQMATAGLALAIGWGRSGLRGPAGLAPRYVTLMIPGLCAVYFAWEMYTSRTARRFLQVSLFTLVYLVMPLNVREAFTWGGGRAAQMHAFENDLRAGEPPRQLAERYESFLAQPPEVAATLMPVLHRAGIGLFRELKVSRAVVLPLTPVAVNAMTWRNGVGSGSGQSSYVAFSLSKPESVSGILLKGAYLPASAGSIEVSFRRSGQNGSAGPERHARLDIAPDAAAPAVTAPVGDTIDEVRIYPCRTPCMFKLSELGLLLPDRAGDQPFSNHYGGVLDLIDGKHITGWAWDERRPGDPVQVDVYDGETHTTIPAGQFRQDLVDAHIGNGKHAFISPLLPPDGKIHIIRVMVTGAKLELEGSPKAFLASGPDATAGRQAPVPTPAAPRPGDVEGFVDIADAQRVAGWAWDKNRPDLPIEVDIRDGNTLLARVTAGQFRQDLLDAHKGNGAHAFSYESPAALSKGGAHKIRVFVSGTKVELFPAGK